MHVTHGTRSPTETVAELSQVAASVSDQAHRGHGSTSVGHLAAVICMYYLGQVGYEWLPAGLRDLRGIEPYEVMQVLNSKIRRPVTAYGPDGHEVLTIWGRTVAGRGLIVAIRPLPQTRWNSQIIGARAMTEAEDNVHQAWEATRDGE